MILFTFNCSIKTNQTQPFVNPLRLTLIGKTDEKKRSSVLNGTPIRNSLRKGMNN